MPAVGQAWPPLIARAPALLAAAGIVAGLALHRPRMAADAMLVFAAGIAAPVSAPFEGEGRTGASIYSAAAALLPIVWLAFRRIMPETSDDRGAIWRALAVVLSAMGGLIALMLAQGFAVGAPLSFLFPVAEMSVGPVPILLPLPGVIFMIGAAIYGGVRLYQRPGLGRGASLGAFLCLAGATASANAPGAVFVLQMAAVLSLLVGLAGEALLGRRGDPLTGLPTRGPLHRAVTADPRPRILALVAIGDLDDLRRRFGDDVAEQALKFLGARLPALSAGRVYRTGENRFALLYGAKASGDMVTRELSALCTLVSGYPFRLRARARPTETGVAQILARRARRRFTGTQLNVAIVAGLTQTRPDRSPAAVLHQAERALEANMRTAPTRSA